MASGDLEYLEEVFLKVRQTKRWTKSFTIVRDAGHHHPVNENATCGVPDSDESPVT